MTADVSPVFIPLGARADQEFAAGGRRIAAEAFGVAVAAWALAVVIYRVWNAPLRLPIAYTDWDVNQTLMIIKGILHTGWFQENPLLGAPFGQASYDFPEGGETLQMFCFKVIGLFTSSPGMILNLYYLIGFGVVATVTHLVLRHLRFGPLVSALTALLFTYAPYHFVHGELHLVRSTYVSVPLAGLLFIWLGRWRERFLKEPELNDGWRTNVRWRRVGAVVAVCVFIGAWDSIITMFTLALLTSFTVIHAIHRRDWRVLPAGIGTCLLIGLTFVLVSLPTLLYWLDNGRNRTVTARNLFETELYGLKINKMLLPSDGSRIGTLNSLGQKINYTGFFNSEGGQSLGLLGVIGLVGLVFAVLTGRLRSVADPDGVRSWADLRETAGVVTVLAILFGTVAGLSTFAAMLGMGFVRTWGRIVIIIVFFALVQVALWGDQVSRWAIARYRSRHTRPVLGALAVLAAALSFWIGNPVYSVDYAAQQARAASLDTYLKQIDSVMPSGSAIMQYPVVRYPENGHDQKMIDYDPLRAYLADEGGLRWSYGGVTGRPTADWQDTLKGSAEQVDKLPAVIGMGFTGLWIDTYGYTTAETKPVLQHIAKELAPQKPLTSSDGRYRFYDLRPYKERLGLSDAQLRALAVKTFGIAPPS